MADSLESNDGLECNVCGFAWTPEPDTSVPEVRDVNGKVLAPGDAVVIVKDLKLDGKSGGIKVGTKIKGIRLISGDHPIQGKVDGRTVLIMADKVKLA